MVLFVVLTPNSVLSCLPKPLFDAPMLKYPPPQPSASALIPFAIFVCVYLTASLIKADFYAMPVTVAFLIAAVAAVSMKPGVPLVRKVDRFVQGMSDTNISIMILIFILAGAFAGIAEAMGAVKAAAGLGISLLPANVLIAGFFLIACFMSLSVGTSVGTIVALVPVAAELAAGLQLDIHFMLAVVVGGAMFGDNLSMISDTTIVATRTQSSRPKEKFRLNLRLVMPAAIATLLIYLFLQPNETVVAARSFEPGTLVQVIPYLFVLVASLWGMHVMPVLVLGMLLATLIGLAGGHFDLWICLKSAGEGILSMGEVSMVALLAGGTLAMIRHNGGLQYLLSKMSQHIQTKRGAEFGLFGFTALVDVFTANNTVALVIVGPVARDLRRRYGISPRRTASLIDTASCFMQGLLPYGAQLLAAVGLAGASASPFLVMKYLFYPYLMGLAVLVAIALQWPRDRVRRKA